MGVFGGKLSNDIVLCEIVSEHMLYVHTVTEVANGDNLEISKH